jgi:hypothetical protein
MKILTIETNMNWLGENTSCQLCSRERDLFSAPSLQFTFCSLVSRKLEKKIRT